MKRFLFAAALLTVGAASIYAAGKDPVTITWKPKSGAVHKYTFKLNGNFGGGDFVLTSDMSETVKSINDDQSVAVENKTTNSEASYQGNQIPNIPDVTENEVFGADGHMISRKTDQQGDDPRNAEFSQFIYPSKALNPGDTWQYKGSGDKKVGTVDYEIDYTYKGTDTAHGIACNKIELTFKELKGDTPITGTGTAWLDASDGELVKMNVKGKNFASPQGPIDIEINQELKS